MSVLLVTYDLNSPGQKHGQLLEELQSFAWAKLSESSYAINTTLTPDQLFERLKQYLDTNDNLYIITLKKPWQGYGPKDVNEWLSNNLSF
ncbi:hypothetical protein [Pseudoalteromonas galatheae]|uniref:hypothetical protein n=1 Tax=Pseudoalteromonas galatheae TaxID=579562 RepID=UPI0030CCBC6F